MQAYYWGTVSKWYKNTIIVIRHFACLKTDFPEIGNRIAHKKWKFWHHLYTLMSFRTCNICFLLEHKRRCFEKCFIVRTMKVNDAQCSFGLNWLFDIIYQNSILLSFLIRTEVIYVLNDLNVNKLWFFFIYWTVLKQSGPDYAFTVKVHSINNTWVQSGPLFLGNLMLSKLYSISNMCSKNLHSNFFVHLYK